MMHRKTIWKPGIAEIGKDSCNTGKSFVENEVLSFSIPGFVF